eukprot:920697-Amphidinium_carterae.1
MSSINGCSRSSPKAGPRKGGADLGSTQCDVKISLLSMATERALRQLVAPNKSGSFTCLRIPAASLTTCWHL